jgi:O-acetyl-ADP-ribose deacetylase (regulator of RNase III)
LADIDTREPAATAAVSVHGRTLRLVQADITTLAVEAFVFYARPNLALGAGFGNAIARRGGPAIKKELDAIGSVPPTGAVVTTGGTLKANHIVHAAGPAFQEEDLEAKLRATVANAFAAAEERGITQLAFPPMGAGFYGIPLPLCAEVVITTVAGLLSNANRITEVIICANDRREYAAFETRLAALRRVSA